MSKQQVQSKEEGATLLGKRSKSAESDLARYGADLVEIFKAHDANKRAKVEFINAQVKYEEACSAVQKLKNRMMEIFDELSSDEN